MPRKPSNFALVGVAGYVAPRHLDAIRAVGGRLIAAADPNDSVGILDRYAFDTRFFTEIERLDRHLEKLRRGASEDRLSFLSVCSPNYLHDAHCRLGLRLGADVICEKPLVINPSNLDAIENLERETERRVFAVLQLRHHPRVLEMRERLAASDGGMREVELTYVAPRGHWYDVSWKASPEISGGVLTNIGIHLLDLVLWLFGSVQSFRVHLAEPRRSAGVLRLQRAEVRWFLSTAPSDLELTPAKQQRGAFRSLCVDGESVEFSDGHGELHTRVYERILAGHGCRISDARPSIELVHSIRNACVAPRESDCHPFLRSFEVQER
jgi:UDP-N-acetyl-2-amino-2-deoxyglucuronate dehydrogenase